MGDIVAVNWDEVVFSLEADIESNKKKKKNKTWAQENMSSNPVYAQIHNMFIFKWEQLYFL